MVCHSLLQWTTFCQTSPPWPSCLGCPAGMAWFHWVRQGCGPSVIRLSSFLWVWFQCVCPLMPSCNTYRLIWVSLTLDEGYLLTTAIPDLQRGIAPLGPPTPAQPPLLRLLLPAVGPGLGCMGGSFQLPSLASGSARLLRVPNSEYNFLGILIFNHCN